MKTFTEFFICCFFCLCVLPNKGILKREFLSFGIGLLIGVRRTWETWTILFPETSSAARGRRLFLSFSFLRYLSLLEDLVINYHFNTIRTLLKTQPHLSSAPRHIKGQAPACLWGIRQNLIQNEILDTQKELQDLIIYFGRNPRDMSRNRFSICRELCNMDWVKFNHMCVFS